MHVELLLPQMNRTADMQARGYVTHVASRLQ